MTHDSEQLEHRMTRYLDGEASPSEIDALEALVAVDPDARRLMNDLRLIDDDARAALRGDLVLPVVAAVATRPRRGTWLATAAGVMAAAATIGLFIFPAGHAVHVTDFPNAPQLIAAAPKTFPTPTFVADHGVSRPESWQMLTPHRDVVDIQQKWVVVLDPKTQRVYLVNMDQYGAATVPVQYEH